MATPVKEVVKANPITFDMKPLEAIKDEKGLLARALKLGSEAVSKEAIFATLTGLAVRSGELDRAAKLNAPRSVGPLLAKFSETFGQQPGEKPYTEKSLVSLTTAYNHFARAGYNGAEEQVKFAVENFKGAFTSRAAALSRMLEAPRAGDLPTQEEMAAFHAAKTAKEKSVSTACASIGKAMEKVNKDFGDLLKAQPSARAKFIIAVSNWKAMIAELQNEVKDGELSMADELNELMAKMAPRPATASLPPIV